MTNAPMSERVRQAQNGHELSLTWAVPLTWPDKVEGSSIIDGSREVHLILRKVSRRGTSQVVWQLLDADANRLDGGRMAFSAMQQHLGVNWKLLVR